MGLTQHLDQEREGRGEDDKEAAVEDEVGDGGVVGPGQQAPGHQAGLGPEHTTDFIK